MTSSRSFGRPAAAQLARCQCTDAGHDGASCPNRTVLARRAALYAGMYDASHAPVAVFSTRVQLLNAAYTDEDSTGRRFAQLEID